MPDEILYLQDKIKSLEKENQYLKSLLDQAGISYHVPAETKSMDLFEPDQALDLFSEENRGSLSQKIWKCFAEKRCRVCQSEILSLLR